MRRLKRGGIALALLLGLAAAALAGDQDSPSSSTGSSWWGSWFGQKDKPAEKKPIKPIDEQPLAPAPAGPNLAASVFEREQANFLRRTQVCDQLKRFALQAGDADQLHRLRLALAPLPAARLAAARLARRRPTDAYELDLLAVGLMVPRPAYAPLELAEDEPAEAKRDAGLRLEIDPQPVETLLALVVHGLPGKR